MKWIYKAVFQASNLEELETMSTWSPKSMSLLYYLYASQSYNTKNYQNQHMRVC